MTLPDNIVLNYVDDEPTFRDNLAAGYKLREGSEILAGLDGDYPPVPVIARVDHDAGWTRARLVMIGAAGIAALLIEVVAVRV